MHCPQSELCLAGYARHIVQLIRNLFASLFMRNSTCMFCMSICWKWSSTRSHMSYSDVHEHIFSGEKKPAGVYMLDYVPNVCYILSAVTVQREELWFIPHILSLTMSMWDKNVWTYVMTDPLAYVLLKYEPSLTDEGGLLRTRISRLQIIQLFVSNCMVISPTCTVLSLIIVQIYKINNKVFTAFGSSQVPNLINTLNQVRHLTYILGCLFLNKFDQSQNVLCCSSKSKIIEMF